MNPHAAYPISPWALVSDLWSQRSLILQLARRDIASRYKGSVAGIAWSFFNPILLLILYTFVFSVVFRAKWPSSGEGTSHSEYALTLFVGMVVHSFFAELLVRSPRLIVDNPSYVKKVVFPLEVMSVVAACTALFQACISVLVLCVANAIFTGGLAWNFMALPLVFAPLLVMGLGVSWTLASLGVFVRDVGQTTGLLATVLLFASPIFYPVSALPEFLQPIAIFNPLTLVIESARSLLFSHAAVDWRAVGLYSVAAAIAAWCGYAWFQKTRRGFADVL